MTTMTIDRRTHIEVRDEWDKQPAPAAIPPFVMPRPPAPVPGLHGVAAGGITGAAGAADHQVAALDSAWGAFERQCVTAAENAGAAEQFGPGRDGEPVREKPNAEAGGHGPAGGDPPEAPATV